MINLLLVGAQGVLYRGFTEALPVRLDLLAKSAKLSYLQDHNPKRMAETCLALNLSRSVVRSSHQCMLR